MSHEFKKSYEFTVTSYLKFKLKTTSWKIKLTISKWKAQVQKMKIISLKKETYVYSKVINFH